MQTSMFPSLAVVCAALCAVLAAPACDNDDSSDDDSGGGTDPTTASSASSADTGAMGMGRCAADQAILSCTQTDCAFDPAEVDCAAACANVAALCANNDCEAQCSGLESDASLCMTACEGTKGLNCSNVVFGCYTSNNSCDDVGGCVDANL